MKKWNAPEVAELNINQTANGIFDFYFEQIGDTDYPVVNDELAKKKQNTPS